MEIIYKTDITPEAEAIIELYDNAGLPRPTGDKERIAKMYANSNLIVTAWAGEKLAGVSRSITDHSWCCYLADLAVRTEYHKHGIGKKLIAITKESIGEESMLLLLSVPTAMEYYPKVGLKKIDCAFIINREK
mgnify:CR=1 FL=1